MSDKLIIRKPTQSESKLVEALKDVLNQLESNWMVANEKGVHFCNERVNMTSAAKLNARNTLKQFGVFA